MESELNFEDMVWLFRHDNRNRGIVSQNINEAALLWRCVRRTKGNLLEIGRSKAGSTSLLAAAAAGRSLYSIDISPRHNPRCDDFLKKGVEAGSVHLIVGDSRKPIPNVTYGFAFIDGDHTFEGVLADVIAHWDAIQNVNGADPLVAFHDAIPNDGLFFRDSHRTMRRWIVRMKNRIRREPKPEMSLNFFLGVYCVCKQLIDDGIAEEVGRACSLWAMKKVKALPASFAQDCQKSWERLKLDPPLHPIVVK